MRRTMPTLAQMLVLVLTGLAVVLAPLAREILPDQFLRDDQHLQRVIADPGVTPENASFQLMASAYRTVGLGGHPYLTATLTIVLLAVAVFLALGFADWSNAGLTAIAVVGISFGFGCVYLAQYTKEVASLVVAVLVLLLLRSQSEWTRFVGIPAIFLLYGLLLRPYWFLIAALVPCAAILLRRRRSLVLVFAMVALALTVLNVGHEVFRGGALGAEREWINDQRADAAVATEITSLDFGESPPALVASALVVLGQLLAPLPLLLVGDIYYAPAAIAAVLLWSVALTTVRNGRCLAEPDLSGAAPEPIARSSRRRWAASVLLSLVLVQATFEPDYGSYFKHLTAFIPLFLVLVPLHVGAPEDRGRLRAQRGELRGTEVPLQIVEGASE